MRPCVQRTVLVPVTLCLWALLAPVAGQELSPGRIEQLLKVGAPVAGTGRLRFQNDILGYRDDIPALDFRIRNLFDREVLQVGDDGSLIAVDGAGTALLRLGAETPKILLDTTREDPLDRVGLKRLWFVAVNSNGDSITTTTPLRRLVATHVPSASRRPGAG